MSGGVLTSGVVMIWGMYGSSDSTFISGAPANGPSQLPEEQNKLEMKLTQITHLHVLFNLKSHLKMVAIKNTCVSVFETDYFRMNFLSVIKTETPIHLKTHEA